VVSKGSLLERDNFLDPAIDMVNSNSILICADPALKKPSFRVLFLTVSQAGRWLMGEEVPDLTEANSEVLI
jgi:hypothetical protein